MGKGREPTLRGVNSGDGRTLKQVDPPWGAQNKVSGKWPTLRRLWEGDIFPWSPWAFFSGLCFFECPEIALWNPNSCCWVVGVKYKKKSHWSHQSTLNSCSPSMIITLVYGTPNMAYYASGSLSGSYHLELVSLGECFLRAPNNQVEAKHWEANIGNKSCSKVKSNW